MWLADIFLSLLDPEFLLSSNFWLTLISGIIIGTLVTVPIIKRVFHRKHKEEIKLISDEAEQLHHELKMTKEVIEAGDVLHFESDSLYED